MIMISVAQDAVIEGTPAGDFNPVDILLRLVSTAGLYRGTDSRLYARVPIGEHHDFYELRSAAFRDWLVDGYFLKLAVPPPTSALGQVIAVLEARARFQGTVRPVFVRVALEDADLSPAYYLDLGDSSGRAVEIRNSGWTIVDRAGVEFRRPSGSLPLPLPRTDGSIDLLQTYVNLDATDFRLFLVWLTAAMRPIGPYPPLVIQGEQGSAKSTLARVARLLIDPHSAPLLGEPASVRDLMITALNAWLLALDNIGKITPWLSDSLCRLATGGGHASRSLFTNDQVTHLYTQRPIILNGIDDFVTRGDLVDRSLFLHLQPIRLSQRRAELDYWRSFHADYPAILGGLLDAIVKGLRTLPSVVLTKAPRMADFAQWGEAVGRGLGWPDNTFLKSYSRNRGAATIAAIEDSPLASALKSDEILIGWDGSITELHQAFTEEIDKNIARSAAWPKTTAQFARELHRIAPQLRMHGISITFARTHKGRRVIIKGR
jgi:hypothetical protein